MVLGDAIIGDGLLFAEFEPGFGEDIGRLEHGESRDFGHDNEATAFDGLVEDEPRGAGHDGDEKDRGKGPAKAPAEESEYEKDGA